MSVDKDDFWGLRARYGGELFAKAVIREGAGNSRAFRDSAQSWMLHALLKHPVFAEGKYEALGKVQSEIAEFLKAVERGTDEEAVAEAKDAVVTLQRFIMGHHLPKDQQGYGWEKRISD